MSPWQKKFPRETKTAEQAAPRAIANMQRMPPFALRATATRHSSASETSGRMPAPASSRYMQAVIDSWQPRRKGRVVGIILRHKVDLRLAPVVVPGFDV